jgi:hypothetical protein
MWRIHQGDRFVSTAMSLRETKNMAAPGDEAARIVKQIFAFVLLPEGARP